MFPLKLKTPHGVISGNVTKTLIYEGVYNFNTALRPVEMGPVQKALNPWEGTWEGPWEGPREGPWKATREGTREGPREGPGEGPREAPTEGPWEAPREGPL